MVVAALTVQDHQMQIQRTDTSRPPIQVPTRHVDSIDLSGKSVSQPAAWSEVAHADQQLADRLLITRNEQLDYIEGIVGDIRSDSVQF